MNQLLKQANETEARAKKVSSDAAGLVDARLNLGAMIQAAREELNAEKTIEGTVLDLQAALKRAMDRVTALEAEAAHRSRSGRPLDNAGAQGGVETKEIDTGKPSDAPPPSTAQSAPAASPQAVVAAPGPSPARMEQKKHMTSDVKTSNEEPASPSKHPDEAPGSASEHHTSPSGTWDLNEKQPLTADVAWPGGESLHVSSFRAMQCA